MPPPAVIALELLFSYGHVPDFRFVLWGLAAGVILIAVEYVRRSSSNR